MTMNVWRYMEVGGGINLMNKISMAFTMMLPRFVFVHVFSQTDKYKHSACTDMLYYYSNML